MAPQPEISKSLAAPEAAMRDVGYLYYSVMSNRDNGLSILALVMFLTGTSVLSKEV